MNLREALAWGTGRLAAVPELQETAGRDAEMLLLHAMGLERVALYSDPDRVIGEAAQRAFAEAVERRQLAEPVQYITGRQEFYGIDLRVSRATLIPRPETELLVESAVAELRVARGPLRILDVGTGTGAIAIAVARELPEVELVAVDLSEEALEVARGNARRHGIEGRITFAVSDLLRAVMGGAPFDSVLSNPPYVPVGDRAAMHPQVREWEPETALFAGGDGLGIYRRLIPEAGEALRPGGLLAMEFGYGQREALAGLLGGWDGVRFLDDLQGIPRVVLARKASSM